MKKLYIFILLTTLCSSLFSQEKINSYSLEQGLSNYSVQSIFKEVNGCIWVGTKDGLNKFDGNNFTQFKNNPTDKNSISAGTIYKIIQSEDKQLWMAIDGGGINIINPITGKIKKIFNKHNPKYENVQYAKDVFIDSKGYVWLSSWGGLIRYNRAKNTFKHFLPDANNPFAISSSDVKRVVEDKNGIIWIATTYGLNAFDPKTEQFTKYFHSKEFNSVSGDNIRTLFIDAYNVLWISTTDGTICTYNPKINLFTNHTISEKNNRPNIVNSFFEDYKRKLWMATEEGIYSISSIYGQIKTQSFQFKKINSHLQDANNIYRDENGIIWFGTNNSGLFSIDLRPTAFKPIIFDYFNTASKPVKSITGNKVNDIWFGSTDNGLLNYNTSTGKPEKYLDKLYISQKSIECLWIDQKNNMWIGTFSDGLFHFDIKNNITRQIFGGIPVHCIYETKYGTMCIGTSNGIKYYNQNTLKPIENVFKHTCDKDHVYFINQDRSGLFWTGSLDGGLHSYNSSTHEIKEYKLPVENNVISFYEDQEGNLWFGTLGGGLIKRDVKGKTKLITKNNGLSSNFIHSIIEDSKQNLWIGNAKGISVLKEGKLNVIRNYNKRDGLSSYEYYTGACYKDNKGNLYFGGSEGIDFFHPDSIVEPKYQNKLIISKVSIYGKDLQTDTIIRYKKEVKLSYNQDFVNIKFNTIDFIAPDKQQYYYRLIGIDNEWIHASNEKSVTYANLKPGEYKFIVKAFDQNPTIKGDSTQLKITIEAPFWETWWFISIVAFVSISIIVFFANARINRLIYDKEIAQFKLKALRSQMNPHFIFNSLNSIQHFIISKNTESALTYLSKFSKLVRRILENSAVNRITLAEEITFLKNYIEIESLRFDNGIDYEFDIDEELSTEITEIPSMLIQPYVENAIIHGLMNKNGKGLIKVGFIKEKNILKCTIEDNGIGRDTAMEIKDRNAKTHKSMGISITKNRLEVLNKSDEFSVTVKINDVYLENKTVGGTRVEIIIPID
jgi:ligand-binding sensor domain-containing protein